MCQDSNPGKNKLIAGIYVTNRHAIKAATTNGTTAMEICLSDTLPVRRQHTGSGLRRCYLPNGYVDNHDHAESHGIDSHGHSRREQDGREDQETGRSVYEASRD